MISVQLAHTAFYVHTHGCERCEKQRVHIGRGISPREPMDKLFGYWQEWCCEEGAALLHAWYVAGQNASLERLLSEAVTDLRRIA